MIKYKIDFAQSFENDSYMLDGSFEDQYIDHPIINIDKYEVYLVDEFGKTISQLKTIKFVHLQLNNSSVQSKLPNYTYNVKKNEIKGYFKLTNCMLHFKEKP